MNCMCGKELNLFNYLLVSYLSEIYNTEELNVIGNFLQLVGQTLITVASQNDYCELINNKQDIINNS